MDDVLVISADQKVLWFDISVDEVFAMYILYSVELYEKGKTK